MSDSRQISPVLQQWAADAATADTNWPTMTAAQKDATTREVIRRLGLFMAHVADYLNHIGFADGA